MTNKIGITVEADIRKAQQNIQEFARDTWAALDKTRVIKLETDLAGLRLWKKEAGDTLRSLQKQYAEWIIPRDKVVEAQRAFDKISSNTTEAQRRLQNYRNTWDENLSRLQKKFNETNETIKSQSGLLWSLKTQFLKLWPIIAGAFSISSIISFFNSVEQATATLIQKTWASGEALKELQTITNNVFATWDEDINTVASAVWELNTRLWLTWEALQFATEQFLAFSWVSGGDVQSDIRNITRLIGDWGVEAENTWVLLDLLTKAWIDSGIGTNNLTNTLVNYGVQLRSVWFSLWEATALISKFEKEWVSTEKMVSGLSQALWRLAKEGIDDPAKGFDELIKRIQEAETEWDALREAIELLGTRAWPDFALAVREGRFAIEDYTDSLKWAEWTLADVDERSKTTWDKLAEFWNRLKSNLIPITNGFWDALWFVWNRVLDFGGIIKRTFDFIWWFIATSFILVWETIASSINGITENVKLLPRNFKIAFDNIPQLAQAGLNWLIQRVENTINKIRTALNQIPWINIWEANLWRIDFGAWDLQAFETASFKPLNLTKKSLNELWASFDAILTRTDNWITQTTWNIQDLFEKTAQASSDASEEIAKDASPTGKWGKGRIQAEKDVQRDLLKETQEYLKKEALLRIEATKNSNATEEEKAKEILAINERLEGSLKQLTETSEQREKRLAQETLKREEEKARKIWEYNKDTEKLIDSLTKTTEDYTKEIEKVWQVFEKLKDDASRNIKDINNELSQLEFNTDVKLAERRVQLLEEEKRLTQEMQEWASIEQLERQKKIQQELLIIEQNANAEILKWVEARSKLSDAERILDDARIQREVLEERRAINEAIANDEEINLEDIQNLKNIAYAEDLIEKRESLNAQLEVAKNNYETELALIQESDLAKRQIESQYTEFLKQQVDSRIADYRRLQAAAEASSSLLSGWGGGNQTSVSQNINVSNSIDAESFLRELSKTFK